MSAAGLATAQIAKARLTGQVEQARETTEKALHLLVERLKAGAGPDEIAGLVEVNLTTYRCQLQLLIAANEIEQVIQENRNGD